MNIYIYIFHPPSRPKEVNDSFRFNGCHWFLEVSEKRASPKSFILVFLVGFSFINMYKPSILGIAHLWKPSWLRMSWSKSILTSWCTTCRSPGRTWQLVPLSDELLQWGKEIRTKMFFFARWQDWSWLFWYDYMILIYDDITYTHKNTIIYNINYNITQHIILD